MKDEWKDLPPELVNELKDSRAGSCDAKLIEALDTLIPMELNDVLIKVWHSHKVVLKRSTACQALQRLIKRGEVRKAGHSSYVRN